MPRHIEIQPSKIIRGDIHVDDSERVQWKASRAAEVQEDGRVRVETEVVFGGVRAGSESSVAEWPDDKTTVRILRRANV